MSLHLFVVPEPLHRAITLGAVLIAVWRGPWRARVIGAAFGLVHVFSNYIFHLIGGDLRSWGAWIAFEDVVLLLVCLACIRGAERYWVVTAAGFALLLVVTAILFLTGTQVSWFTFASADRFWWYGLAGSLVWGAITEGGRTGRARSLMRRPGRRSAG